MHVKLFKTRNPYMFQGICEVTLIIGSLSVSDLLISIFQLAFNEN